MCWIVRKQQGIFFSFTWFLRKKGTLHHFSVITVSKNKLHFSLLRRSRKNYWETPCSFSKVACSLLNVHHHHLLGAFTSLSMKALPLLALLHDGEGDDLSTWKLCSLCHTQGSAFLLWRYPGQFFPSSTFWICHVFVQWPHLPCPYHFDFPFLLECVYFPLQPQLIPFTSLLSGLCGAETVMTQRVTLGSWKCSRAEHSGGRTQGLGKAWCWALRLGDCLATRAALELLSVFLLILAEPFLPVKFFNFLLQSLEKNLIFFHFEKKKRQKEVDLGRFSPNYKIPQRRL